MSSLESVRAGESGETAGFLAGLDEDEIATVLGYTEARRYAAGELAIRRGDADRSLFVITGGAFEVLVPTTDGPRQVSVLRPGDIFGELAFFDGEPRSADVRALESSEAFVMTPAGFERLRLAHPRLAIAFLLDLGRMLSSRFRDAARRLASQRRP